MAVFDATLQVLLALYVEESVLSSEVLLHNSTTPPPPRRCDGAAAGATRSSLLTRLCFIFAVNCAAKPQPEWS